MTYTNTTAVNENFQSIKEEGSLRTKKVTEILKSAFSEAVAEVKDGATTVRPLAKDLAGNAVQVVKEKGQEAYVNAKQAAEETGTDEQDIIARFKLKLQAIVDAIKATLLGQTDTAETVATEPVAFIEQETEVHTVVTEDAATTVTVDSTAA
ncbi:hypothetical protein IQ260_10265 [Leptolyngbya cf. ectocarpi LEGE 11479]|uniref:Uncharacterized protein n=1 Tax=Leptolyngbya cf. ectocarpi LEGE 11479 TaxID=1828722 RepID=A0A928X3Q5_LEPEC|nr:hypothetical protein [Leptolyngbya ectocarpi]MBE9067039.1 hypothetical protein [Leptolyngbya cf. ectocarpi LEGE 11479]